jgi:hypothetical protein
MKPVVVQPDNTFEQLAQELGSVSDEAALTEFIDQFIALYQRKKRVLIGENAEKFNATAEREAWDKLWADVKATRTRAHQAPPEGAKPPAENK